MTRDDLTSIIQLAGIKRNISEDGMPTPGYDGSGNRIRTVADPKLGAGEGDPFAASATAVSSTGTPQSIASDGATADSGVGINKFKPEPAKVSTQSVAPAVIKTTVGPGTVSPASGSGSGPSGVDPDVQAQIERLRGDWNNRQSTDVGNNPDYHGDVNPSSGGGKPAMPAAEPESKKKTLAPVDEKLKPIQEKLKALGYDLGPTGIDGRMGKYTRQAIDAFKAGTPPGKTTTTPASKPSTNNAQLLALKQQAERQRKSGDEEGARATERAMAQISTPAQAPAPAASSSPATSTGRGAGFADPRVVKPGEPPPKNDTTAPAARSATAVSNSVAAIASKYGIEESVTGPIEQIQKIRQLIDEAETRVDPALGDLASLDLTGKSEPKLGPSKPAATLLGGKPPAAVATELATAQQAGQLGLKSMGLKALNMIGGLAVRGLGWYGTAYTVLEVVDFIWEYAKENSSRITISPEDINQLGRDKKDLKALIDGKNLTPADQEMVKKALEKIAKLLAGSEVASAWGRVGIPGRSGAPKNK